MNIRDLLSSLKKKKDEVVNAFNPDISGSMANRFWTGNGGQSLVNVQNVLNGNRDLSSEISQLSTNLSQSNAPGIAKFGGNLALGAASKFGAPTLQGPAALGYLAGSRNKNVLPYVNAGLNTALLGARITNPKMMLGTEVGENVAFKVLQNIREGKNPLNNIFAAPALNTYASQAFDIKNPGMATAVDIGTGLLLNHGYNQAIKAKDLNTGLKLLNAGKYEEAMALLSKYEKELGGLASLKSKAEWEKALFKNSSMTQNALERGDMVSYAKHVWNRYRLLIGDKSKQYRQNLTEEIEKTAKQKQKIPVKPSGVNPLEQNNNIKPLQQYVQQPAERGDVIVNMEHGVSQSTDPLIQEARKYKSAEEFVKARVKGDLHTSYILKDSSGRVVGSGTKPFDLSKYPKSLGVTQERMEPKRRLIKEATRLKEIYKNQEKSDLIGFKDTTLPLAKAERYVDKVGTPKWIVDSGMGWGSGKEYLLDNENRAFLNTRGVLGQGALEINEFAIKDKGRGDGTKFIKNLVKSHLDSGGESVVVNKAVGGDATKFWESLGFSFDKGSSYSNPITKSQLTDIWNKANKEKLSIKPLLSQEPVNPATPYNQNLSSRGIPESKIVEQPQIPNQLKQQPQIINNEVLPQQNYTPLLKPGRPQLPSGEPMTKYIDRSKIQKPLSEQGKMMKQSPETAYALWKQSEDKIKQSSIFNDDYVKQLVENEKIIKSNPAVRNSSTEENLVKTLPKNTPVNVKVGILDYFRTPDRVLEKIGLKPHAEMLRKANDKYLKELPEEINKITEWYKQVPDQKSAVNIFKKLDGQKIELTPQEEKIAGEIKTYLSEWADKLKLPEDKRITNYITHIFDDQLIKKEFDDDLAKIIQDKVAGSVYDPFTQQRLGAQGYKENVWDALDAYVKRATRKYNMDPALEGIKDASKGLELSQYNYVKSYVDKINMRPTELDNLIDNSIKQIFGYRFTARPTAYITRKGRQMIYRGTLGLNVGSAVRNLTQGVNTYARLGEKYTLIGYTKLLTNGTDELNRVGVLSDDIIQDRSLNATKKAVEKLDKGLFYMFELAEKINRGSAYFGAKAKGIAQGMSEEQAIEFAKKVVRDTQFTFGKIDTPVALQSDIAKSIAQFQSYNLKQTEFLGEMVKNKDVTGLTRYAIGSFIIVATIGKLIGVDLKQMLPSFQFRGGLPPSLSIPVEVARPWVTGKDQYGNELDTGEKMDATIKSLIPIMPGGVQINKTIQGIKSVNQGYSGGKSGNVQYPIKQSASNLIRAGLFGKNNLPEAQQYFDSNARPLSEKQSLMFKQAGDRQSIYDQIMSSRENDKLETQAKEQVKNGEQTSETPEKIFYMEDGEVKSVYKDRPIKDVVRTGNTELDKQKISDHNSDVTAKIKDIVKLNELGYISDSDAEKQIKALQAKKISTKKLKIKKMPKMKALKTKKVAMKPLKLSSVAKNKIKVTTPKKPDLTYKKSTGKQISVRDIQKAFAKIV